ncbi:MAG: glycosyltransferase family 2 protein [Pseudomonadota bacterium]
MSPSKQDVVEPALVSIVMPSLNQDKYIGAAIDSILAQDYANVELVVADGGSTDQTLGILSDYSSRDARLRWSSRPDNGPAQALNIALAQVRGTIIGWLNSDDLYTPGAIRRAVDELHKDPRLLMVYGQAEHVDKQGETLGLYPTLMPATPVEKFKEGCFICQPSMFFRRTVRVLLGNLDETLKASFDFDYWLRAFLAFQDRIGFVDVVQAKSRLHDDCITLRMRRSVALEGMEILSRHLGSAPKEWFLTYVDELLLEGETSELGTARREHLVETATLAAKWLSPDEKNDMEAELLRRLNGN